MNNENIAFSKLLKNKGSSLQVLTQLENKLVLSKGDCLQLLTQIENESVDAVITDPPYQYLNRRLKNCHFDKPYNEDAYIAEIKRILKDTGFIIMFGRGVPFYRQGVLLDNAGFKFKEEVIWDKRKISNFTLALGRQHENCFIFAKTKKGIIRKTHIPYIEYMKGLSIEDAVAKIKNCIRKIDNEIKKPEIFKDIINFLEHDVENYVRKSTEGNNVIRTKDMNVTSHAVTSLKSITKGYREKDVMNIPDIIEIASSRNHHHPTEKPIRLMERLIALVTDEGDVVLDPFMGSGTTGVACMNTKRRFIGMEIDDVYFKTAEDRIIKETLQQN